MLQLFSFSETSLAIIAVISTSLCALFIFYFVKSTFFLDRKTTADVPKECSPDDYKKVVEVYLFKGPGISLSGSPFSTKLSTYLRLTGIPHTVQEADFEKAPKSKVPYIKHGDTFFGDSQLIIRYIENSFDVKSMAAEAADELGLKHKPFVPYNNLKPKDRAMSDLIRLTCEGELYWSLSIIRWGGEHGMGRREELWEMTKQCYFDKIPSPIRNIITRMIRVNVLRDAWGQGLIRHSPSDQLYLTKRALQSLSSLLGDKYFFLGAYPAECDCIAFGTLDCFLDDSRWPNEVTDFINSECTNLVDYVARIRSSVFPDVKVTDDFPAGLRLAATAYPKNN